MQSKPDIDHLIILYLTNSASALQKQELEQWINASEANRKTFEHLRGIWSRPNRAEVDQNLKIKRDAIWKAGTSPKQAGKSVSRRMMDMSYWGKIAATFLIIFLSTWVVYNQVGENAVPDAVAIIKKVNPAGQKSMHMLPDGTQVWLNAESSLTYPEIFSDTLRLVKLTGEAFFEVAHNKKRTFIVETSGSITQALGTAFNIQAYPEDQITRIALLEGKVRVQDLQKMQTAVLSPGEEVFIPKNGAEFNINYFDYEKAFGWKEGILLFDGVDFETFRSILENWYGVKIDVIGAPEANWNIRARYVNESLRSVMRDISFNKNFIFKLKDKDLIINFNQKPMI